MAGSSSIHPDEQWLLSIAEHHGGGRPNEPSADILREALTQSEVQRLTEAMSNTDFCELLQEYTKQSQDASQTKEYQEYVRRVERERGAEVDLFLTPKAGVCVKVMISIMEHGHASEPSAPQKLFVNITHCQDMPTTPAQSLLMTPSADLDPPTCAWSPVRDDTDAKGARCLTVDCVLHPDAYTQVGLEVLARGTKAAPATTTTAHTKSNHSKGDRKSKTPDAPLSDPAVLRASADVFFTHIQAQLASHFHFIVTGPFVVLHHKRQHGLLRPLITRKNKDKE